MKIVHIADTVNEAMGGPARSIPALATAQARLGHEVTLVCRDFAHLGPRVGADGVRVEAVPSSRREKTWGCFGIAFHAAVRRSVAGADVVHVHGLWTAAGVYARKAVALEGRRRPRLVVSTRGMLMPKALARSFWKKRIAWHWFERKNLEAVDLFHATSAAEAGSLEEALRGLGIRRREGDDSFPIVVVPNGVQGPARIADRRGLEERFPDLRGKRWVIFLGRIHEVKGVRELVQAWAQIGGARKGWVLGLAGPWVDASYVASLRSLAVGGTVWMGELRGEEKWAALGRADFVVVPSHTENFSMTVAESLAAGRPVVTTTGTPWGEAETPIRMRIGMKGNNNGESMNLEERKCGVICEVTDLKRGLERMLEFSDKQREEMGGRGREWMRREFSWEASAERLINAYQEAIG